MPAQVQVLPSNKSLASVSLIVEPMSSTMPEPPLPRPNAVNRAIMLAALVTLAGAAIVIAATTILGFRLHSLLLQRAPGLAALIPRDGGAIAGLVLGLATVAGWFDVPLWPWRWF